MTNFNLIQIIKASQKFLKNNFVKIIIFHLVCLSFLFYCAYF